VSRVGKTAVALGEQVNRSRFLDALYREYSRALIRFLGRQNIGHEDAREIVQETYCRLQQVPQVEQLESPRGYLFRTALNLVRDNKRQRRRQFRVVDGGEPAAAEAANVPSDAPTAFQDLEAEQDLTIIRAAILELGPTCRRVFIMHRFESATYAQIAARCGVSVSMIEKHVSHALAHLKTCLDAAHSGMRSRKAGS
jgi:RNA polymerase sigma factor (sigma-70 family)